MVDGEKTQAVMGEVLGGTKAESVIQGGLKDELGQRGASDRSGLVFFSRGGRVEAASKGWPRVTSFEVPGVQRGQREGEKVEVDHSAILGLCVFALAGAASTAADSPPVSAAISSQTTQLAVTSANGGGEAGRPSRSRRVQQKQSREGRSPTRLLCFPSQDLISSNRS